MLFTVCKIWFTSHNLLFHGTVCPSRGPPATTVYTRLCNAQAFGHCGILLLFFCMFDTKPVESPFIFTKKSISIDHQLMDVDIWDISEMITPCQLALKEVLQLVCMSCWERASFCGRPSIRPGDLMWKRKCRPRTISQRMILRCVILSERRKQQP